MSLPPLLATAAVLAMQGVPALAVLRGPLLSYGVATALGGTLGHWGLSDWNGPGAWLASAGAFACADRVRTPVHAPAMAWLAVMARRHEGGGIAWPVVAQDTVVVCATLALMGISAWCLERFSPGRVGGSASRV